MTHVIQFQVKYYTNETPCVMTKVCVGETLPEIVLHAE